MKKRLLPDSIVLFLFLLLLLLFVQNKFYTGNVTDDKNTPLSGVTVTVRRTKTAVVVNKPGIHAIQRDVASPTLPDTNVDQATQEVVEHAKKIILSLSASTLNDVMVIGCGTTKRSKIISSNAAILEKGTKDLPVADADLLKTVDRLYDGLG